MDENCRVFPGDASNGEIEIEHSRLVWQNDVARLFVDTVRFPSVEHGRHRRGEQFRLVHGERVVDGVVVAAVDADSRIILVRQFRHPVRMWVRELPRGGREAGELPEDAARRELREETGYEAGELIPLGQVANDTGQLEGMPHLFVARATRAGEDEQEATETIDCIFRYRYTELKRACQSGAIVDGMTIAAVLRMEPLFDGDRFVRNGDG